MSAAEVAFILGVVVGIAAAVVLGTLAVWLLDVRAELLAGRRFDAAMRKEGES